MKALVAAGGTGSRLRPLTFTMPKQLVPVGGRPVLVHVLENLAAMGVRETGIVVNDREPDVRAALGDGGRWDMRITYLRQDEPAGLADCVRVGRDFLGDDDFVMYLGDVVLGREVAIAAEEFRSVRPAAHVVVTKVADPRPFGVVELGERGRVTGLEEKPRRPRSDLVLTGVYFFTSAVHAAVATVVPGARGELEITDAIRLLLGTAGGVRASVLDGPHHDTGSVDGLLAANRTVLDTVPTTVTAGADVDEHSVLVPPVRLAPGAQVRRSRVVGPAVVGAGAVVDGSTIGPHVTLGDGVTVHGSRVEDSILMERTAVHDAELTASVLSRDCAVHGPAIAGVPLRLVLGERSEVRAG